MKKRFFAILGIVLLCSIVLVTGVYAAEADAEEFELTLLHEGGFPGKSFFSRDLSAESEIIREGLFSKDKSIEISADVEIEEAARLYEWVVNSEPELYYVLGNVSIKTAEHGYIIYPEYEIKAELLAFDDSVEFKKEVENILSYVDDDMSDVEKALAVHDYFARFYEYDYTYTRHDIEDIFVDKTGVCQAYADGFTYIMQKKLGIDCYTLASDALNHAWNVIKIDGEWYHIDITWDDPRFNGKDHFGNAHHRNFLVSSDTLRDVEHEHNSYDWEVSGYTTWRYDLDAPSKVVEPDSTKFESYVWATTGYSPFIYYEDEWYYTYLGYLYKYDVNKNESTEVMELDYYYSSNYDTFEIYEDTVFFKYYWGEQVWGEHMTYMYPMNGSGSRLLSSLNGVYSFRRVGDSLECIKYEDGVGNLYALDLTKLEYKVKTPVIMVDKDGREVSFSCDTDGVEFYYTTDGQTPTTLSESGDGFYFDEDESFEIKVIAVKEGYNTSDVASMMIDFRPAIINLVTWEENKKTMVEVNVENAPEDAVVYVVAYNRDYVISALEKLTVADDKAECELNTVDVFEYKIFMWAGDSMKPVAASKEF